MSRNSAIKVMVVDDHYVVRSGLAAFLLAHPDMQLAGEAETGEQAVEQAARVRPDVVLMDLVMPGMGGIEATRQIRQACPETQVVALTSFSDAGLVQGVMQAGAIGYLLKNITAEELAEAVRAASRQQPVLSPEATEILIRLHRGDDGPAVHLTGRESEVLALMADGLGNREIADRLYLSPATVKGYVSLILAKLGAHTRAEAVALALKHRLIH